jgi:prolyl-tRNA editing enzyme YbaK/EbsC (Cys-tRNA(Pro) deacylase)
MEERSTEAQPAEAQATQDRSTQDGAATQDAVIAQLTELDVAYELVPCDPELADTAAFCEAYGYAMEDSANAIVVAGKADPTVYVMCLVLANTRLDVNKVVRKRLGVRKCSFASADQTKELTGMEIGGVTPFGSSTPLDLWIDARVMERDRLIIGGGGRDRKLLVPPETLAAHPGAHVVQDLAKEEAGT